MWKNTGVCVHLSESQFITNIIIFQMTGVYDVKTILFREAAKLEIKALEKIQQKDRGGRRY